MNNKKNKGKLGLDSPTMKNNKRNKKRFFIENIAKYCDKCGSEYIEDNIQIVQETNFSSIVHFSCDSCKSNHIATFVKPMGISSRMPVNTDLSIKEIAKFARFEKVSSNEVLELYDFLNNDDPVAI